MPSGNSLVAIPAYVGIPPASDYATLDTRNGHPVADFDDTTDESLMFSVVMPSTYDGNGIDVEIYWSATSATSGNAVWSLAVERISDGNQDVDSDGFATAKTVTDAAPATAGFVTMATVSFANGAEMDSVGAGESFRLKVTRDADNVSDTLSGDIELHHVHVRES